MRNPHALWGPRGEEHGVALATVVDTDDKDALGRIKVEYLLKQDKNGNKIQSDWLQFVSPFAGSGHGIFFLPDVGTRALVAFSGSDPARAYVIGFLWDGEQEPPVEPAMRQSKRVIQTKKRKKIVIDDSDEGNIEIVDEKGNSIKIDSSSGRIQIKCEGGVSIESTGEGPVSIKCEGNLSMTAAQKLTINAAEIAIEAEATMSLRAANLSYD